MTALVSVTADRLQPAARHETHRWPLLFAGGLVLLITLLRASAPVDSDVAWQLWVAGRLHAGAALYTDIVEVNPPLWYWMAVPIERFASALGLPLEKLLIACLGIIVLLSLAATGRLIAHLSSKRQGLLLTYGALTLTAFPWMHVGQREHLLLIAAVPYCALIAARQRGDEVSPSFAVIVGVGAGLGFALKHYFLIAPLMLELWLFAGRSGSRPLRPETFGVALVGALYALAVLILSPDFLERTVPLVQLTYSAVGAASVRDMLGPFVLVGLSLLGLVVANVRLLVTRSAPFSTTLSVAAVSFAAAYFIQFKGWPYHSLPLIGCASLALAALLCETTTPSLLQLAAPTLLALPLALSAEEQLHSTLPSSDLMNAVSGLPRGAPIGFLTTESAIPWSITLQGGYRYASRYSALWMIPAIVRNERLNHPDVRIEALGREIVRNTVIDFTCVPPARIIVSRPRTADHAFDVLPFFLRDPNFAALLTHYRERSRSSLETFEQVSRLAHGSGTCRHGA